MNTIYLAIEITLEAFFFCFSVTMQNSNGIIMIPLREHIMSSERYNNAIFKIIENVIEREIQIHSLQSQHRQSQNYII